MDALDIKNAYLIDHSLGGTIALALALDYPERVRKVVLVSNGGFRGEISRKGQLLLSIIRGIKRLVGKEKSPKYDISSIDDWLVVNRLHELKPQVMIVWGERDPYLPISQARLAHSLIPDCQLYIFPGCRHAPQRERPEKFNKLVCHFLNE